MPSSTSHEPPPHAGTARPTHSRPPMVSAAARGMSHRTVEKTTSTPRTTTIPHRQSPQDAIRRLAPQADKRFPHRHRPPDLVEAPLQTPDPAARRPSSSLAPYRWPNSMAHAGPDHHDQGPRHCPPRQPHELCRRLPPTVARRGARYEVAMARVSGATRVARVDDAGGRQRSMQEYPTRGTCIFKVLPLRLL
jgi:hypothetical protein